jgi:hypothetical protein
LRSDTPGVRSQDTRNLGDQLPSLGNPLNILQMRRRWAYGTTHASHVRIKYLELRCEALRAHLK